MDDLSDIIPGLESEVYPMTMATQLYSFVCSAVADESLKKEIEPFVVSSDVLKSAFKFLANYQSNNNKASGDRRDRLKNGFGRTNGHTLKQRTVTSKSCLTVFSSPYKSRKPNVSTELPSYVKQMMEKDASLRRLLKTGNVTISHIPHPSRERLRDLNSVDDDDDEEDDDGQDSIDDESVSSNLNYGSNLLKKLAKKASEDATTATTTTTAINNNKKELLLSTEDDDLVEFKKSITGFRRQNNITIPSKRKSKQQQNQSSLSISRNGKTKEGHNKSSSTTVSNIQNNHSNRSGREHPTSDNDIDPTKFLEVSFREEENDEHRRKYNCPHCLKRFNWSTDLKRHILTHTGERPFKCDFCSANFTRKFLMQKHARKHHQEQLLLRNAATVVDTVVDAAQTTTTNGETNGYIDNNHCEEEEEEDFVQEDFVQEDFVQEDFIQEDFVQEEEEDNLGFLESESVSDVLNLEDERPQVYANNAHVASTEGPIIINVFSSLNENMGKNENTLHLNGHHNSSNHTSDLTAPRKLNQSMVKQLANADVKSYRHNAQRRFISLVKS